MPLTLSTEEHRFEHLRDIEELDVLFSELIPVIKEYEAQNARPDEYKVVEYKAPTDLSSAINVEIPDEHGSIEEFVQSCKATLTYSVRTSHPRFMNQLYAGSNPSGQLAELLIAVLNSTVHTYSAGPVFSVVEQHVIKKVAELLGFDPDTSDGLFVPGGSYANLATLMVARTVVFPHVAERGFTEGDRPVVFTSAHAHYSILKAVMIMGIGTSSLVDVATDSEGRMLPSKLDEAIQDAKAAGKTPMAVCAVAGTTVLGAFDPLDELADVCQRHGVWLHVDGAWGGAVMMSPRLRGLLHGVARADSFCFNPHKLLGVPLQCSMILVNGRRRGHAPAGGDGGGERADVGCGGGGSTGGGGGAAGGDDEGLAGGFGGGGCLLRRSCGADNISADYLFHQGDCGEGAFDHGHKSLQCGRRPDGLKLWLCWKRLGTAGFARRVEAARGNAEYLADRVGRDPRFLLVRPPASFNVCFYYVPPRLRGEATADESGGRKGAGGIERGERQGGEGLGAGRRADGESGVDGGGGRGFGSDGFDDGGNGVGGSGDGGGGGSSSNGGIGGSGGGGGGGGVRGLSRALCDRLGPVTTALYGRLRRGGTAMVNFSPLPDQGLAAFFRAVLIQPTVTHADLDFVLEEMDRLGQDL